MDREDQVVVLRVPILVGGGFRGYDGTGAAVAAELHSLHPETGGDHRKEDVGHVGMDQEVLHRIAYGGILRLGIDDDIACLLLIRASVHIDMADSGRVAEHRDPGVRLDVLDERVRAARDQKVDIAVHVQYGADVVAGLHEHEGLAGDPLRCSGVPEDTEQDLDGAERLASTLERHRVPRFETEGHYLRHHVGTGLEDHAEHAYGASYLIERQPVVEVEGGHHLSDGVLQTLHVGDACDHGIDAGIVDQQTAVHRICYLARIPHRQSRPQILRIGFEYLAPAGVQRGGHGVERTVLYGRWYGGQRDGCVLGGLDLFDELGHNAVPSSMHYMNFEGRRIREPGRIVFIS